jgi:hypothetical protein
MPHAHARLYLILLKTAVSFRLRIRSFILCLRTYTDISLSPLCKYFADFLFISIYLVLFDTWRRPFQTAINKILIAEFIFEFKLLDSC